ncbi:WAT1-related protein [Tanacetum coccineum]
MEKVGIGEITGKAKVVGTLVAVGGAMLLTFYKGQSLNILSTHFNILHGGQSMDGHVATSHKTSSHQIMGAVLALGYSLAISLYFSLQGKLSANYPCHYSTSFLFGVFGFIQSFVYVVSTERSWSQWKLGWNIRLVCVILQGIGSLAAVILVMAAVHLQGPLFGSVFSPLVLVFVAIAGFLLLDEQLHVGTVIGSVIIVLGLYVVLWGKSKETKRLSKLTPSGSAKESKDALNTTTTTTLENISVARSSFSTGNEGDDQLHIKYPRENHAEQEPVQEEEMKRLEATGEYTEDEINALARGGKLRGHIPGVGRVLPSRATSRPSMPAPDKSLKSMHRKVDFMMSLFRSDSKYSDMFKEFESGGASGSGGCGDDEEGGDDEDGDSDE